jgi:hypothetical protein
MKSHYLLPHFLRKTGFIVLIPSLILGIMVMYADYEIPGFEASWAVSQHLFSAGNNNLTDELASICFLASLFLIAFTEERIEDEWVMQVRLDSLQWAVYVNYGLLAVAILLVYNTTFFEVLVYNMYTILIFFILRFNYLMHVKFNPNRVKHEK